MECVHGETAAPPELQLYWMCNGDFGTLAEVQEQDYFLINRMSAASNIYRTLARLRNMQGVQIHQLTDGERRILRRLRDMGILYG